MREQSTSLVLDFDAWRINLPGGPLFLDFTRTHKSETGRFYFLVIATFALAAPGKVLRVLELQDERVTLLKSRGVSDSVGDRSSWSKLLPKLRVKSILDCFKLPDGCPFEISDIEHGKLPFKDKRYDDEVQELNRRTRRIWDAPEWRKHFSQVHKFQLGYLQGLIRLDPDHRDCLCVDPQGHDVVTKPPALKKEILELFDRARTKLGVETGTGTHKKQAISPPVRGDPPASATLGSGRRVPVGPGIYTSRDYLAGGGDKYLCRDEIYQVDIRRRRVCRPKAWAKIREAFLRSPRAKLALIGEAASGKSAFLSLLMSKLKSSLVLAGKELAAMDEGSCTDALRRALSGYAGTLLIDDVHLILGAATRALQRLRADVKVLLLARDGYADDLHRALTSTGYEFSTKRLPDRRFTIAQWLLQENGVADRAGFTKEHFASDFGNDLAVFKWALAVCSQGSIPTRADARRATERFFDGLREQGIPRASIGVIVAIAALWQYEFPLPDQVIEALGSAQWLESQSTIALRRIEIKETVTTTTHNLTLTRHPQVAKLLYNHGCAYLRPKIRSFAAQHDAKTAQDMESDPAAFLLAQLVETKVHTSKTIFDRVVYSRGTLEDRERAGRMFTIAAEWMRARSPVEAFDCLMYGTSCFRRGMDIAGAERLLQRALSVCKESALTAREKSRLEYERGYVCYLRGDYEAAISAFRKSRSVESRSAILDLLTFSVEQKVEAMLLLHDVAIGSRNAAAANELVERMAKVRFRMDETPMQSNDEKVYTYSILMQEAYARAVFCCDLSLADDLTERAMRILSSGWDRGTYVFDSAKALENFVTGVSALARGDDLTAVPRLTSAHEIVQRRDLIEYRGEVCVALAQAIASSELPDRETRVASLLQEAAESVLEHPGKVFARRYLEGRTDPARRPTDWLFGGSTRPSQR